MEEARPLFSSPRAIPGPVPADAVAERPANTEQVSSSDSNPFATPLDRNAPQLFGTVAHAPDHRAPASNDPQSQPRSISSFDAVPVVAPGAGHSELLGDLGLSSSSFDVEAIRRDFPILREWLTGAR
jgi:hypothetical protein